MKGFTPFFMYPYTNNGFRLDGWKPNFFCRTTELIKYDRMIEKNYRNENVPFHPAFDVRIHFEPWIGKNYLTCGYQRKRILVLGESHYCSRELAEGGRCYPLCKEEQMDTACVGQTKDVVYEAVYEYSGQPYQQTFLCFERAVAGKVLTQREREDFWESVMFYNYIQFAQSGPRTAPLSEHWAYSEKALKFLLTIYEPDYIIVWGARLYNGLPGWDGKGCKLKLENGDAADYWIYNISGKEIPALKIHHPSAPSGKNWEYWHLVIDKFLNAK